MAKRVSKSTTVAPKKVDAGEHSRMANLSQQTRDLADHTNRVAQHARTSMERQHQEMATARAHVATKAKKRR
jgi:hypothetical protein